MSVNQRALTSFLEKKINIGATPTYDPVIHGNKNQFDKAMTKVLKRLNYKDKQREQAKLNSVKPKF